MAVIERFRFKGKDMGLLGILYPYVKVLKGPHFPPFMPWDRIIVVSEEKQFHRYRDKEVIQITSDATTVLDTRIGFLSVLPRRGVKATNYQLRLLLHDMSYEEFWYHAKLSLLVKGFPGVPRGGTCHCPSTVLDLFDSLFTDFSAVYRHYWELRKWRSMEAILAVLLEMTAKSRDLNKHSVGSYYRRILRKNRKYHPLFLAALEHYHLRCDPRDDWTFLGMLAACSSWQRPESCPPWFDETDSIACSLQMSGYDPNDPEVKALFPGLLM